MHQGTILIQKSIHVDSIVSKSAIVGNFGSGRFFDYTAYGDTINIAARLEAANKQLGTHICVSARSGGQGEGLPRPAGGGPVAARPVGDLARLRAAADRAIPGSFDQKLSGGICQAGNGRRRVRSRPSRRMSASTPDDQLASFHLKRLVEWSDRHADRFGLERAPFNGS